MNNLKIIVYNDDFSFLFLFYLLRVVINNFATVVSSTIALKAVTGQNRRHVGRSLCSIKSMKWSQSFYIATSNLTHVNYVKSCPLR